MSQGDIATAPLPADGPPAALGTQVMGIPAGNMDLLNLIINGQNLIIILQEDRTFPYGLSAHSPVFVRTDCRGVDAIGQWLLKKTQSEFLSEYTSHSPIDTLHTYCSGIDGGGKCGDEPAIVVGDHHHVNPRIDGGHHIGVILTG